MTQPEHEYKMHFPYIAKNSAPMPRLATYLENVTADRMQYAVPGQEIAWGVKWSEVEKVRGEYDWSKYDQQYANLGEYPHRITVKMTPEWARIDELKCYPCAPPKREYWEDYAEFTDFMIDRYRPYAVELWNEPDAKVNECAPDYFGCWGGLGGAEYGEFVKYVYNYLKPGWLDVTIMGGALMVGEGKEDQWQFAADFLECGQFDVLSYHTYTVSRDYDLPFRRLERLRGMTDKPIWLSEGSYYWSDDWGEMPDSFEWEQAHYLKYLAHNAMLHDLPYVTWYTLANNNWHHTDLVESDRKKLAWYAFEKLLI